MTASGPWLPEHSPNYPALLLLMERFLPGESHAIRGLREDCARACANPLLNDIVILGGVGSGKTFLARLLALGKEFVGMDPNVAERTVATLRLGRSGRLDWDDEGYQELTVTGLAPELAQSELFGHVAGAFTGAESDKRGVFQRAKEASSDLAEMTGGVVFLDEIVDLPMELQAKLLAPCGRSNFYRVGDAGGTNIDYQGVIIAATWNERALRDHNRFRPDLLSRLEHCTIRIPGLQDRMEDFELVVDDLVRGLHARWREKRAELETKLAARSQQAGTGGDAARYWAGLGESQLPGRLRPPVDLRRILPDEMDKLRGVDWSQFGELRGLTSTIEATVLSGASIDEAIARLGGGVTAPDSGVDEPRALFSRLLERRGEARSLNAAVKDIELADRTQLRHDLSSEASRQQLSRALRIDEKSLPDQVRRLDRRQENK